MDFYSKTNLNGKTAVISGAARNIGKAFAEALASVGANVCLVDTDQINVYNTTQQIACKYNVRTSSYAVDITQQEKTAELMSEIYMKYGSIDICVANAGIFISESAENMSTETWSKIINVNLTGAFYTAQAAAHYMIKHKKGSIIFTTSISAHQASKAPSCAYSASKGGLLTLVHDLANEWGKYNIRVNSISPGNIDTGMLTNEWRATYQHDCELETVIGRLGKTEELQGALIYLASDISSYTTGAEIVVDGGYIIK
ncbi:SDR family oxidoreductase [uncultured Cloacibacillus sp.]|uniref:SDR family oxidoreductase n=1 Tax=uncultured Cloacibacillus sp. TaxID=889794 RepID=UPI00320B78E2